MIVRKETVLEEEPFKTAGVLTDSLWMNNKEWNKGLNGMIYLIPVYEEH